jgi:hypothetical protein
MKEKTKYKIVKCVSITFIISFFIVITIVCLMESDKPSTGHSHWHTTKPEDEHRRDYVVEEKIPEHVKTENILFEVTS